MENPTVRCMQTEHKAVIGTKEIIVHNIMPVFMEESERKNAEQKIERGLFDIFSKYMR